MVEVTEKPPVRLLLLHSHGLFRASLGRLLASEPGFLVLPECATPTEALAALSHTPPDVVLLEFDLGGERGTDFMLTAVQAGYPGKFLIISNTVDATNSAMALKLGASGIFLESEPPERLIRALRLVAAGDLWVDPRIIQVLADGFPQHGPPSPDPRLTDREHQVLTGVVAGLTNRNIATSLGTSEGAVKAVLQQLFRKAGVRTRTQLARAAFRDGLGSGQNRPVNLLIGPQPGVL